jgi:hypothetical protein
MQVVAVTVALQRERLLIVEPVELVVSVWLEPPSGMAAATIADVRGGMEALALRGVTTESAPRAGLNQD